MRATKRRCDNDRITSVTPPSPASAINYTWDDNGDLTARGSDSFSWDYEDRMVSPTVNSVTTTFAYRGDGLRDSRAVTGGATTTFTWDIAAGLPVVLDDGNQYLYGAGLTAQKQSGNWVGILYYLADGLGSTMAVVNASGAVQDSYTYDVYGTPTKTGSLANEFDFAGQQTDGTGLQYLRARYYDPATGTFLSREPMANMTAWLLNATNFGTENPARFSDPSGLYPIEGERHDGGGGAAERPATTPTPSSQAAGTPVPAPLSCWQVPGGCAQCAYRPESCASVAWWDPKAAYYSAIVRAARPSLREYHAKLRDCAKREDCRAELDEFFRTLKSLNATGFDANFVEGLRSSPWPWLAGAYTALKTGGTIGFGQVWSAYKFKYGSE